MKNLPFSPWISLWLSPRKIFYDLYEKTSTLFLIFLSFIGGAILLIPFTYVPWMPGSSLMRLFTLFFMGGFFGILHLYVGSWLYERIGFYLGGKGSFASLKCAIGWSFYPFAGVQIFLLFWWLSLESFWLQLFWGVAYLVFTIWAFVIFLILLSTAHGFSIGKALVSWILYNFSICAALVLLSLFFVFLKNILFYA